ncbi:transposable element Tcb1 transposase [Trichonephila clavipes]|nr:transposable element Tcb1 transposase [Trichonephila clavipes]
MQEEATNRRGQSHPPRCIIARDGMRIVRITVMDYAAPSRTTRHQIQSVMHHSVYTHANRRRLQQSEMYTRRPLFHLPLTGNHKCLRCQWRDERWTWTAEWKNIVLTYESHFCLQHHDDRIRDWKHRGERLLNCCVMHRHAGPTPGIMVWGGIRFHCHTPVVLITGRLNSQRCISEVLEPVVQPYIQRLPSAISQQDNA